MSYTVMMVAGAGNSTRMGEPKLRIRLDGEPVLLRTLHTLQQTSGVDEIVLITRAEDCAATRAALADAGISKLTAVVAGGNTRQQSVAQGLVAVPDKATLIGIHDAARPLVSPDTVAAVLSAAARDGAAAAAVKVKDTIKQTDADNFVTATPDRDSLWQVQTPQVFAAQPYRTAMAEAVAAGREYTDDCQLMEQAGFAVRLVPGTYENIKLTTPEDVAVAAAFLQRNGRRGGMDMRIGHGYDVHRLVEGRPLILGGVKIPYDKGLLGHSDADVLTHAVMDALLGAAAMGDIGSLFPDTDPAFAGADSLQLLQEVVRRVAQAGYIPSNIDATVLAQCPKLKPYSEEMRQHLADVCGIAPEQISVKATTEEGLGFTGSGEGIAAHAICLLRRL